MCKHGSVLLPRLLHVGVEQTDAAVVVRWARRGCMSSCGRVAVVGCVVCMCSCVCNDCRSNSLMPWRSGPNGRTVADIKREAYTR